MAVGQTPVRWGSVRSNIVKLQHNIDMCRGILKKMSADVDVAKREAKREAKEARSVIPSVLTRESDYDNIRGPLQDVRDHMNDLRKLINQQSSSGGYHKRLTHRKRRTHRNRKRTHRNRK